MIFYIIELFLLTTNFVYFFVTAKNYKQVEQVKEHQSLKGCRVEIGYNFTYIITVLFQAMRICTSCYMAIKQSRSIEDCNKEFYMVLSHKAEDDLRL